MTMMGRQGGQREWWRVKFFEMYIFEMYILDTNIFSITSPASGLGTEPAEAWRDWVKRNDSGLYFSVMTIMEVRFGIEKLRARGASPKADRLTKWLASAETLYRSHIIPVSIEIAHRAGELLDKAVSKGAMPSSEDAIVAATAEIRGFKVLSRNGKNMKMLTGQWINPLVSLPPGVSQTPHD